MRELLLTMPVDDEVELSGVEDITISAVLRGADVESLHVDASSLDVRFTMNFDSGELPPDAPFPGESTAAPQPEPEPDPAPAPGVVHRERGRLRTASIRALPLTVQGVPVELEASAQNVDFEWLELDDGDLAIAPVPGAGGRRRPSRVTARVAVARDDITAALVAAFRAEAGPAGVHITREKLTLRQSGPRRVQVGLRVRIRWKLLAATVRFRTEVHIDSGYVLRLRNSRLSSSNPVVTVLLAFFRRHVREGLRELEVPSDLNEGLAPFRLRDLRIRAGRRVDVRVELES